MLSAFPVAKSSRETAHEADPKRDARYAAIGSFRTLVPTCFTGNYHQVDSIAWLIHRDASGDRGTVLIQVLQQDAGLKLDRGWVTFIGNQARSHDAVVVARGWRCCDPSVRVCPLTDSECLFANCFVLRVAGRGLPEPFPVGRGSRTHGYTRIDREFRKIEPSDPRTFEWGSGSDGPGIQAIDLSGASVVSLRSYGRQIAGNRLENYVRDIVGMVTVTEASLVDEVAKVLPVEDIPELIVALIKPVHETGLFEDARCTSIRECRRLYGIE